MPVNLADMEILVGDRIRNFQVIRTAPFTKGGKVEKIVLSGLENVVLNVSGGTGGSGGGGGSSTTVLQAPIITRIDAKNGIVYFDNPSGMQVEVYKYTRKQNGPHTSRPLNGPYSDRLGKRYKPIRQLPNGATSYTVQTRWINGGAMFANRWNKRNYFKLGARNPTTGERSELSSLTIMTAVKREFDLGGKIYLENAGGGESPST